MDFSAYNGGATVPEMHVSDLPDDAQIFVLKDRGCLHLCAGNNSHHWEYRREPHCVGHVWRIWVGPLNLGWWQHAGYEISKHIAAAMVASGSERMDSALLLPDGF